MKPVVLIVSSDTRSSMEYSAGLTGYGCEVMDVRTLETARALLRTHPHLDCIIFNMRCGTEEARDFLWSVRGEPVYRETRMMFIGSSDREAGEAVAVWATFLPRPADISTVLAAMHTSYEA